jgi:hypothetical protein
MLLTALALVLAADASSRPLLGSHEQCVGTMKHVTKYTASVGSAKFVDLDGDLGSKLEGVTCDVDHTRLVLTFKHETTATEWLVKFHDFEQHFIVGGKSWNCTTVVQSPQFILRRVVGASEDGLLGRHLTISTAMARYDEVFESADISYGATADAGCAAKHAALAVGRGVGIDDQMCVGANANCATTPPTAKKPLPLFSAAGGALTATCTDCFAALSADVFLEVHISGFKLQSLSFGLKNVSMDASVGLSAKAAKATTLGLDKTLELLSQTYLLDFKVGSVPFMLYFDVPLAVKADLDLSANAALSFGATARLRFGEIGLTWDKTNHWQHVTPTLTHQLTPSLTSTSASLDVAGSVALTPAFRMHFDRMFSYSLTASPTLDASITGSLASKQACLNSSYAMSLVATSELDINIDLVDFHRDWHWGPTAVGTWSGIPVPSACVPLAAR